MHDNVVVQSFFFGAPGRGHDGMAFRVLSDKQVFPSSSGWIELHSVPFRGGETFFFLLPSALRPPLRVIVEIYRAEKHPQFDFFHTS